MWEALPALLAGAALAGLLSGAHCAAMCGGIAGALGSRQQIALHRSRSSAALSSLFSSLPQNLGRISGYALAGALAGAAGSGWIQFQDGALLRQTLFALANGLLIALGLSLMFGQQLARAAERLGGIVWQRIKPAAAALMRDPTPGKRLLLGLLWGAMPCALVYAMLLSALGTGSPAQGAMLMLAFGLGTLPNLLAVSLAWAMPDFLPRLKAGATGIGISFKALSGAVMLAFGIFGLLRLPAVVQLHGLTQLCHPGLQ
jgi:uncharacterized protein